MLVSKAVQLALVAALVLQPGQGATTSAVKLCGRRLSEIMSKVCHVYNSPSWDDPTVVEQPAGAARRKRQIGIADQCCTFGCTFDQLNEYCAISANSESSLDEVEAHMVSSEHGGERKREALARAPLAREVGRRRRCWCRRRRRAGRRRGLMGNMDLKNVLPAAVVGTVSPLLAWSRTLHTDLPPLEQERYNYIAVYS